MSNKNTLFIGKVFHHFDSLESTNQYALNLISKSKPIEGTVISTYNQTKGRGQIGSNWESGINQSITLSIILYPDFLPIHRQFLLNQIIALGVRDFISVHTSHTVKVKWPNDVYVNDKKITGILIQNSLSGKKIATTIVGIGINVNQTEFSSDLEKATSLSLETNQQFDLNKLIPELCFYVEAQYLALKAGKFEQIEAAYLKQLYRYQQAAYFIRPDGQQFEGVIEGITEYGKLCIRHAGGLEHFDIKEITFK